jgi:serine/threonine-protein kinase
VLQPGVVLSERYRLDDRLGRGAMGDVWRATDLLLGRTVAVKTLLPALIADTGFSKRFFAEARIMAALHHPGIVNVYDYGQSELSPDEVAVYLVMELVEGEPLSARMEMKGRLGVAETLSMVSQVASALHAAHEADIIHRDVKPSNLLVTSDGTIRLADFGVARSIESAALTATNAVLGTARYMAPEQALGRSATAAVDIYALGAVAYHCLAGVPPFQGETPIEVALHHVQDEPPPLPEGISPQVRSLISRAMAKDPALRFPSAAAFGHAAHMLRITAGTASETESTVVANGQPIRAAALVPAPGSPGGAGKDGTTLSDMLPVAVGTAWRRRGTKVAAAGAGLALALLATFVFADMRDDHPTGKVTPTVTQSGQPSTMDPSRRPGPSGGRSTAPTLTPTLTPTPSAVAPQSSAPPVSTAPTTTSPPEQTNSPPPPATSEASPRAETEAAQPVPTPETAPAQVSPEAAPSLEAAPPASSPDAQPPISPEAAPPGPSPGVDPFQPPPVFNPIEGASQ